MPRFRAVVRSNENTGPNTLTFILPAELFPTRYRCFCHGIAAATGKVGSIIIQVILPHTSIYDVHASAAPLAKMLGIFAVLMAIGALFAWSCIPTVQKSRPRPQSPDVGGQEAAPLSRNERWTYPSIPLELLAEGRKGPRDEDQGVNSRWGIGNILKRKQKSVVEVSGMEMKES
jgi:PHS family inorganic phosphate transporter-like MFS transporter